MVHALFDEQVEVVEEQDERTGFVFLIGFCEGLQKRVQVFLSILKMATINPKVDGWAVFFLQEVSFFQGPSIVGEEGAFADASAAAEVEARRLLCNGVLHQLCVKGERGFVLLAHDSPL